MRIYEVHTCMYIYRSETTYKYTHKYIHTYIHICMLIFIFQQQQVLDTAILVLKMPSGLSSSLVNSVCIYIDTCIASIVCVDCANFLSVQSRCKVSDNKRLLNADASLNRKRSQGFVYKATFAEMVLVNAKINVCDQRLYFCTIKRIM